MDKDIFLAQSNGIVLTFSRPKLMQIHYGIFYEKNIPDIEKVQKAT